MREEGGSDAKGEALRGLRGRMTGVVVLLLVHVVGPSPGAMRKQGRQGSQGCVRC